MNTVPVIRLELQGMKATLQAMLQEEAAKIDSSLQRAVEAFCSEGNLERVIREEASKQLEAAIQEEVRSFFNYTGAGRRAVRETVLQYLNDRYPLDDN